MSDLHFVRLVIKRPELMRFAQSQGLLAADDDGHGYALHAWLAAMFAGLAPKPFRFLQHKNELLGYSTSHAAALIAQARAFATPLAFAALEPESLASKPMPESWRLGQRLQIEVMACPISRKDGHEKDIFLRALDRLGDQAPDRKEVYADWLVRQCQNALQIEHAELTGLSRGRLLRRGGEPRRAQSVERPQAIFKAVGSIADSGAFSSLLARGVGRHRAFGFGMVLVSPVP